MILIGEIIHKRGLFIGIQAVIALTDSTYSKPIVYIVLTIRFF